MYLLLYFICIYTNVLHIFKFICMRVSFIWNSRDFICPSIWLFLCVAQAQDVGKGAFLMLSRDIDEKKLLRLLLLLSSSSPSLLFDVVVFHYVCPQPPQIASLWFNGFFYAEKHRMNDRSSHTFQSIDRFHLYLMMAYIFRLLFFFAGFITKARWRKRPIRTFAVANTANQRLSATAQG